MTDYVELQELKKRWMKDPKFTKAYNNPGLEVEIGDMITEIRLRFGLTQAQLARKIGTKQSSIARVENGNVLPSLKFLQKIAKAVGMKFVPPSFGDNVNK